MPASDGSQAQWWPGCESNRDAHAHTAGFMGVASRRRTQAGVDAGKLLPYGGACVDNCRRAVPGPVASACHMNAGLGASIVGFKPKRSIDTSPCKGKFPIHKTGRPTRLRRPEALSRVCKSLKTSGPQQILWCGNAAQGVDNCQSSCTRSRYRSPTSFAAR